MKRTLREHAEVLRGLAGFGGSVCLASEVVLEIADQIDALLAEIERLRAEKGEKVQYTPKVDFDALVARLEEFCRVADGDELPWAYYLRAPEVRAILTHITDLESRKDAGILAQRLGEANQQIAGLDDQLKSVRLDRVALADLNRYLGEEKLRLANERDAARAEAKEQSRMRSEAQGELAALRAAIKASANAVAPEHAEVLRRAVEP